MRKDGRIDYSFDIQYVISLIVLVFTISNAGFKPLDCSYLLFFFFALLHLTLLSLIHSFSARINYLPFSVEKLKNCSEYTLIMLTLSFVYLIVQIFIRQVMNDNLFLVGIPLLVVVGLGSGALKHLKNLRYWNKLELLVNPTQLNVYDSYDEMDTPVLVKIENKTKEEVNVVLEMQLPEKVHCKIGDNEYTNLYSDELRIQPKKHRIFFFYFKHSRNEPDLERITLVVSHKQGKIEQELVLFLRV